MLADWRTAPVGERLRSALGFLEKLTLRPAAVDRGDVDSLRDAGLTDEEIEGLIHVCTCFSLIDRLADAFGVDVPAKASFDERADRMLAASYRIPSEAASA